MRNIKALLITLLCLVSVSAWAQNKMITGTVVEDLGGTKEPIYGANVIVVNNQNRTLTGAITDLDGNYILQIPANEKNIRVQVSFIGLKSQTVTYNGQKRLDFTMASDSRMLQDVEVVTRKVDRDEMGISFKEQTSANQKIEVSELIEAIPVASVEEALQGQIAGMDIIMGGDPGTKSAIRIRGISSLNGSNDPLIVIDDVPVKINIDDGFDFATANDDDFGALLNLSPSDIESIEVLKDASATAIYGTDGAAGVLLVKTKKGAVGKTKFDFSTKFSVKEEPSTIPMLNGKQYIALMQDAIWNAANANGLSNSTSNMELLFNTPELNYTPTWQYCNEYNVNTNWLDEVRQDAWSSDNTFSVSGGGDKATYRFSLGYLDDIGTTIGTKFQRVNAKLRVDYKFSDRLRVYTDFSYTDSDREANAVDNVRSKAQTKMPNLSPYYMDDNGNRTDSYFTRESDFQGSYSNGNYNPVAMVHDGYKNTVSREEKMTINVRYDFPFKLVYQAYVSMNLGTTQSKTFLPQSATGVLWTSTNANRSTEATSDNFSLQTENKLMYNNVFAKKHSIVTSLHVRTTSSRSASSSNATYGNVSQNLSDPVVGSIVASTNSGESESRNVKFIANGVYTYDNRYVLRATVNSEGNSAMGKDARFALFPAFGAAWNIYQEKFMEDQKWMTEGKIRFGIGWSGKAPGGYAFMGAYKSLGTYMDMAAIYPVRMQLDKLKWESSREYDLGIDLRLWDRLSFTFDYYDKYTSDCLLSNVSIPSTTGYATVKYMNSGEMSNKGYEIRFDYDIIKNKNWKVTANVNMARNINKVEKIPENYTFENYSFGNGNYAVRIVEGDPIGSFYGYKYKGVFQNEEDTYAHDAKGNVMYDFNGQVIKMKNGNANVYPGDAKYEDVNYDGVINENDIVYLGNSNPIVTGGGGISVRYTSPKKNTWSLTSNLHGRFGQKVINSARMNLENMRGTNNQSTAVLSRWRKEGDDTMIPRALYGMGYNYLGSDRFVEDASYVRLKSISITWSLPKEQLKKIGLEKLSLFLTGYDLFTWSDYSGQNPEVSLPSKATDLVKDGSSTPVSKRFAFGVNLSF